MLSPAEFWRQSLFLSPPCRIPSHIQHRQGFAALPSCVQLPLEPCPGVFWVGRAPQPLTRQTKHHWPGPAPGDRSGLCYGTSPNYFSQPEAAVPAELRSPQLPSWGNWRWLQPCRLRAELG